jgi:hypothetical protein
MRSAFRALDAEQRLAAAAAIALVGSLLMPWWRDPFIGASGSGLGKLTFLEAALVLIAVAVLALLFERAEGRVFHLPLSDGTLIAGSGVWACFLVFFRMLDTPTTSGTAKGVVLTRDYEIRWGIVLALASAIVLVVSGTRTRRKHHRGEPEAVAADVDAVPTQVIARTGGANVP